MSSPKHTASGSCLLLDEYFEAEDPRFLDELAKISVPRKLAGLADRWKKDPRPWARQQIVAYLDRPLDRPGHHPLVRRLFKHAEERRDDGLMAAFLVAFDRCVRRRRRTRFRFDAESRAMWQAEELFNPRDSIAAKTTRTALNPVTGRRAEVPVRVPVSGRLFSHHTRYYLRRRAWRYFRCLGYQRPQSYCRAVAAALERYRDEDFAVGENILDNRSLMHVCFGRHEGVRLGASKVDMMPGRSIADLKPAPWFPQLWKTSEALRVLLSLLVNARSRLVRVWAMDFLRRDREDALNIIDPDELFPLLGHPDGEVQQFAAEVLQRARGLEKVAVSTWLRLLETPDPGALAVVADVMRSHVLPERLTTDQCIDLACAAPSLVAWMGLDFLRMRHVAEGELARLAQAKCAALAAEIAAFALSHLGNRETYDREAVIEFFDSTMAATRQGACFWLAPSSPGYDDPILWCRLLESPYDDVRMRVVDELGKRSQLREIGTDALAPVWCSVLTNVHRGSRQKSKAIRQIAEAIIRQPDQADALLPVIRVAVRSIRGPERRAGLSAVVSLVDGCPELADTVAETLPELDIEPKDPAP